MAESFIKETRLLLLFRDIRSHKRFLSLYNLKVFLINRIMNYWVIIVNIALSIEYTISLNWRWHYGMLVELILLFNLRT
jgi:hypothetical protein